MSEETLQQGLDTIVPFITRYGIQILGAIVILILGRIASSIGSRLVRKALTKAKTDPALVGFLGSGVSLAIMAFAVVAALAKFGIQTTSFIAVLGAAGLAVGLALQGSLSNFASGVMIMFSARFGSAIWWRPVATWVASPISASS